MKHGPLPINDLRAHLSILFYPCFADPATKNGVPTLGIARIAIGTAQLKRQSVN
jgi:hypothetical protein